MKHLGFIIALSLLCFNTFYSSASAKIMSKYDHSSLLKAVEDYRFNDLESAIKSLEGLQKRFPEHLRILHFLGLAYQENGEYVKAIKTFELWLKGSKDTTSEKSRFAWMGISRSHIGLQNYWEAVRSIQRWLKN
ncbi:MAG: hypothetical protein R8M45_06425, partial [Ghiorsea sp.]